MAESRQFHEPYVEAMLAKESEVMKL
jgi:hypothetical protein